MNKPTKLTPDDAFNIGKRLIAANGVVTANLATEPGYAAEIETKLAAARTALTAAETASATSQTRYDDALASGDKAAVVAARAAREDAAVDVDIARARVSGLERDLDDAKAARDEGVRLAAYSEALAARDGAAQRLRQDYERAAGVLASIATDIAKAESLASRVNRDLPEGCDPIESAEALVRWLPGAPRKILQEADVHKWAFEASGLPIGDNPGYPLHTTDGVTGILRGPHNSVPVVKKRFRETRFIPETRVRFIEPLAETLRLPALLAGDPPIWSGDHMDWQDRRGFDALPDSPGASADAPREEVEYRPL